MALSASNEMESQRIFFKKRLHSSKSHRRTTGFRDCTQRAFRNNHHLVYQTHPLSFLALTQHSDDSGFVSTPPIIRRVTTPMSYIITCHLPGSALSALLIVSHWALRLPLYRVTIPKMRALRFTYSSILLLQTLGTLSSLNSFYYYK